LALQRYCPKDSLLDMTVLVFSADDEANVFVFFQRIVTLEYEAFVLRLDEGEVSGNVGEDGAHAASDDLAESFDEREFFLVEGGVFRHGEDDVGECRFCNSMAMSSAKSLLLGKGRRYLGSKSVKCASWLVNFVAQAWVGKDLAVTGAFAALHERRDECMLVVHGRSVAQKPKRSAIRKLPNEPESINQCPRDRVP